MARSHGWRVRERDSYRYRVSAIATPIDAVPNAWHGNFHLFQNRFAFVCFYYGIDNFVVFFFTWNIAGQTARAQIQAFAFANAPQSQSQQPQPQIRMSLKHSSATGVKRTRCCCFCCGCGCLSLRLRCGKSGQLSDERPLSEQRQRSIYCQIVVVLVFTAAGQGPSRPSNGFCVSIDRSIYPGTSHTSHTKPVWPINTSITTQLFFFFCRRSSSSFLGGLERRF